MNPVNPVRTFIEGMVLRVHPRSGSHTQKPYYVVVVDVDVEGFTTLFPGLQKRRFNYEVHEWRYYHHDRFELMGMKGQCGHLLDEQQNKKRSYFYKIKQWWLGLN